MKVPASYLCRNVGSKPYILSLDGAKRIIVEMYGESVTAYKNFNDIFSAEKPSEERSDDYPDAECPKFPSYIQLKNKYNSKVFYIEKTLQQ